MAAQISEQLLKNVRELVEKSKRLLNRSKEILENNERLEKELKSNVDHTVERMNQMRHPRE